jgi:type I restriction enzyme S subunit
VELTPGYKKTEIGILPETWELVPFSDILDFRNGLNADKSAYGAGTPFANVFEIINNSHLHTGDIPGRIRLPRALLGSFRVLYGDALFNRSSETQEEVGLAATYMGSDSIVFGGFVIRARPKSAAALDPLYSGYALRSKPVRKQIVARGQGAIRANVGQQDLRSVLFPRPPLPEQRTIAEALSDVDALLGALARLIAKKRDLKRAATQQLLTGKTRLPGFTGKWQTKQVAETGDVLAGKALAVQGLGPLRPYLRTKNVLDGRIDLEDVLAMPMTDAEFKRFRIMQGDVLLNEGQSLELVGRCSLYRDEMTQPCAMQNQLLRFRARTHTSPSFAEHLFRHCQHTGAFCAIATQTTSVAHLGSARFKSLRLLWPLDRAEQDAIATVLSDMDAELVALDQRRAKTRLLKQGMMQELLTGRTRLV